MTEPIKFIRGQHIHLIGIGGTGMSAIARVLLLQGFRVSGSDLRANAETVKLNQMGAIIYIGHDPENVFGADIVIRSSAIKDKHVEVLVAKAQNIPVYKRYDVMSAIMEGSLVVAVAGTHGKTTTTSMITHVLIETKRQPSYIIGGVLANTGHNADVGQGRHFVIEADEYDNMFHGLKPNIIVLTSVEFDHPDFFETPEQLIDSFQIFVNKLPDDGLLICCADDTGAMTFAQKREAEQLPVVTYGIDASAMWRAINIRYEEGQTLYDIHVGEQKLGSVRLNLPGRHNILNSMAALVVAHDDGISFDDAASALSRFEGTGRRFDVRADIDDIVIIDDYAHHPTAIASTLDAARQRYPQHELWAVWQPHTFSRTRSLWDAYLNSFGDAHHVLITDIYASREKPENHPDVRIEDFIKMLEHDNKTFTPTFELTVDYLIEQVKSPAVILIMSAGDAPEIGIKYAKHLEHKIS